jgi:hypothetical protein
LILLKDHKRWQAFTIITWVLVIGFCLFWGLNNFPKLFWEVWGIWLSIALTISTLILEAVIALGKRPQIAQEFVKIRED